MTSPQLTSITVGDDPAAWEAAGFSIAGNEVVVGEVRIVLVGQNGGRGIRSWAIADLDHVEGDGDLDGLPTTFLATGSDRPAGANEPVAMPHPNGVLGLDHIVVSTPDLERTIAALEAVGLACRRIRATEIGGTPMRQAFFRAGTTIIEVVGGTPLPTDNGEDDQGRTGGPARWFGLALDVDDLDRTVALLDQGISTPKAAVQQGRRIATLRHRTFGLSVAVAAMDDHGDR